MKKIHIIPNIDSMDRIMELKGEYELYFEYNDFFLPKVLDDDKRIKAVINRYKEYSLPQNCTLHGAFYDVIPFSPDEKIREISLHRIEQSIEIARYLGAGAVVFHTNYNPFLNMPAYIEKWIEDNIGIWSDIIEKHSDMNIYLENMFDTSPYILKKLAEGLCHYGNFGLCFDYAHASLSGTDTESWASKLGKYIKHIHINDNDLKSDLHLAWGDGKIDRQKFYDLYKKYMSGAGILIETSGCENILKSLRVLEQDNFIG